MNKNNASKNVGTATSVIFSVFISFHFIVLVLPLKAQLLSPSDPMRDYVRSLILSVYSSDTHSSGPEHPKSYLFNTGLVHQTDLNKSAIPAISHPWQNHLYFSDAGSATIHSSQEKLASPNKLVFRAFAPSFYQSTNTELPLGGNDGALWQGAGRNQTLQIGYHLAYQRFRVEGKPQFLYSENLDFPRHPLSPETLLPEDVTMSEWAEPLVRADLPQRFGNRKIYTLDPGMFSARLEFDRWMMGISKASMWAGPSYEQPLLLGNHAPPFWHGHIGTGVPIPTVAGHLFGRIFWGHLQDSEYFMDAVDADRYVNGLHIVWMPWFANGLELGYNRVMIGAWPGTAAAMETWFNVFRSNPREPETSAEWKTPQDEFFAKSSFTFRYAVPNAGFEIYAEYGRNDYRRPLREFLMEPEINRAHLFGFLKRFDLHPRHWLTVRTELVMLENNAIASTYRPTRTWFEHPTIYGGFTHKGQSLGSSLGPGGSTQMAVLRWYHPFGMIGVRGARVVHNNDRLETYRNYYMTEVLGRWDLHAKIHMIEMNYGMEGVLFLPFAGVELQFSITSSRIENIYNQRLVDMNNIRSEFGLRFYPASWVR